MFTFFMCMIAFCYGTGVGMEYSHLADYVLERSDIKLTRRMALVLLATCLFFWWAIELEITRRYFFRSDRKENSDEHR